MIEFIFYIIVFYIIIKLLNAVVRWWRTPSKNNPSSSGQTKSYSNSSKYKDVEEVKFTEIELDHKKEKV